MTESTTLSDFMIIVDGVDCDNEEMPLTKFLEVNDNSISVEDVITILNLQVGETAQFAGYAPGCDFTVKRSKDLDN